MIRSILVPLDGSPFGEQALPLALTLAREAHASVQLAHVHVPIAALYNANEVLSDVVLESTLRDQNQKYLDHVLDRVERVGGVRVSTALLDGPVVPALLEHVAGVPVDLIVMSTHGRGAWSRFWLGGVADKLMRRAPTSTIFVHPREKASPLAEPVKVARILIPLDGSELAERVLEPAMEVGGLLRADYTLLRVIEPMLVADYPADGTAVAGVPEELRRRVEDGAREYLQRAAERFRARSLRAETRLVIDRLAAEAIVDQAGATADSMIALESRGRSGLARMLLGSVADKVVRAAPVPVLVHHPQRKEDKP